MNEQLIAKLAYETLLRTGAPTGNREWQKIFTELIVKECLKIVEPSAGMACGDEWYTALEGAAQEIKEHFGVTE